MKVADKTWSERTREKYCPVFVMSCTNVVLLLFKILEYYTLASFAFKPESIWMHDQSAEQLLNYNNSKMPFDNNFKVCFYGSLFCVIIYQVLTVINAK